MSNLRVETYDRLDAAAQAMKRNRRARYLGGGTLVMRDLNDGDMRFDTIVRVTDPSLSQIRVTADRIVIGSNVTMADVIASRELTFLEPAARSIGGPAIRNMATVGGNLFAEHPYGDLSVALLALDGRVTTADDSETLLADFFTRRNRIAGDIVASISIARPASGEFRFAKVSRIKPKGVAVMSMAAWLPQTSGRLISPAIAYGAMAPTPVRVTAVERALAGRTLDAAGIAGALSIATEGLTPPDDAIASQWYRREIAPVHLRRLLLGQESI